MAASIKKQFIFAAIACVMGCSAVAAEQLEDPTRPAIQFVPGVSGSGEAEGVQAPAAPPPGLQSVIISSMREAAIINGTEVELGQRYGDAVLTVVNETCVVLIGPRGRQVMHMFPTVSLSKDEVACDKRAGMQPLNKLTDLSVGADSAATNAQNNNNAAKPKTTAKKRKVTSVAADVKDGSGK